MSQNSTPGRLPPDIGPLREVISSPERRKTTSHNLVLAGRFRSYRFAQILLASSLLYSDKPYHCISAGVAQPGFRQCLIPPT
jgi:hypothetical protein